MTICYFGDYDPSYNRTKVLMRGLRESGVTLIECNVRAMRGIALYYELWKKHREMAGKYDVLIVGYSNARLLPVFARILTRRRVAWDALYSLYDNWVFDRRLARPRSLKARWYWLVDWLGCIAADLVILDTDTNTDYFVRTFTMPKDKFVRVLVGADTECFAPGPRRQPSEQFEVEFHGKYIPVQGTDVIVRAARLVQNEGVHMTMIGSGQDFKRTEQLAKTLGVSNVTFLPFLPPDEVARHIQNADVCIGLLGDVPRVIRAIPNKLYEAAASGRVSISANSTSLREVFTPGVDTIGIPPGNPEALAEALRDLKRSGRALPMGEAALATFRAKAEPREIVQDLLARILV